MIKKEPSQDAKNNTCVFFNEADKILLDAVNNKELKLSLKLDENGCIKKEHVSDVHINESFEGKSYERPVIDLVQQGGGMYGIALLGYTYIMEKVGIRFYSHGGASAGGINALFMAAIENNIYNKKSDFCKSEENPQPYLKSEVLTDILANTDFSSFMDKKGFIGRLQKRALKNIKYFKMFMLIFSLIILITIYTVFGFIYSTENGLSGIEIRFYDFVIGTLNVCALMVFLYILFVNILGRGFGINRGKVFYNWADDVLKSMNVFSTEDIEKRMCDVDLIGVKKNSKPKLVLISTDLTHNKIVKFPEEANLYWGNYKNVKPVAYLRATMSIPFVFKVFTPDLSHYHDKKKDENRIKLKARFVDGGMLSNFPIREFHAIEELVPKYPTFGVLLTERKKVKKAERKTSVYKLKKISLLKFITSVIATFRNFYDNDFMHKNDEIKMRTVTVNTKGYNWLNFWISEQEKINLFKEGAKAAIEQLEKFNWEEYKRMRKNEC